MSIINESGASLPVIDLTSNDNSWPDCWPTSACILAFSMSATMAFPRH